MQNQIYAGTPTSRRFALCPVGIVGGQPVLIGGVPAVAMTSYQAVTGGAVFEFGGSFALSVTAASVLSPVTGHAIKPGDPVYADGGTLDSTTNVTYGFTLDAASGSPKFGELDPTGPGILTTATNAAANVLIAMGM